MRSRRGPHRPDRDRPPRRRGARRTRPERGHGGGGVRLSKTEISWIDAYDDDGPVASLRLTNPWSPWWNASSELYRRPTVPYRPPAWFVDQHDADPVEVAGWVSRTSEHGWAWAAGLDRASGAGRITGDEERLARLLACFDHRGLAVA